MTKSESEAVAEFERLSKEAKSSDAKKGVPADTDDLAAKLEAASEQFEDPRSFAKEVRRILDEAGVPTRGAITRY